jgi:hypothetical protein
MGLRLCVQPAVSPTLSGKAPQDGTPHLQDTITVLIAQELHTAYDCEDRFSHETEMERVQTCVVVGGPGGNVCAPKPLPCVAPAECAPLSVLPKVEGPNGSADAVLSGPNVVSDKLQTGIHQSC